MKYFYINIAIVLSLFLIITSSCTTYSLLPQNINSSFDIVGVYSNISQVDSTKKNEIKIWQLIDHKHEIKTDNIQVKVEIVSPKVLKFVFIENDKEIGGKLLKGKFRDDNCFYTRKQFYVIPILPILWWYENGQKRIYQINNQLIIETSIDYGGAFIFMAGGNKYNNIYKFNERFE